MSDRPKLDFAAIKEAISLEQVAHLLSLPVKKSGGQYRCECPQHPGDKRGLAITAEKGFYCFGTRQGGDSIGLYAHVKDCSNYDAALALSQRFQVGAKTAQADPPPFPARPENGPDGLQPLTYLEPQHQVLELLGLSPAVCEALGAGYAPKGTMLGRVVIPLRMPDGKLVGYLGIATKPDQEPLLKFPNNLEEMCQTQRQPEQEPQKHTADDMRKILRVV